MKSFRAVCITALLFTVPAVGQSALEFTPRQPLAKVAVVEKPVMPTGRVIVKFKDEVKARIRGNRILSSTGTNLNAIDALSQQLDLSFKPLFGDKSEMALRVVEMRATAYSGKAQPDLAGMMYVDVPAEHLEELVAKLHAMNIVEFVEYDQEYETKGGAPDPACGEDIAEDCFSPNATPFCDDLNCCNTVCGIYPFCCDEDFGEWNVFCADLANLFCGCEPPCHGGPGADRCNAPILGGGCFDTHPFTGCNIPDCCNLVCDIEPFCCTVEWDAVCRNIASDNCEIDDTGVTPDFSEENPDPALRRQQFRTVTGSEDFLMQTGFTGQGFDMAGLWDVGQLLIDLGLDTVNRSNGLGIRVGVVEHSAHVNTSIATGHMQDSPGHEDLQNVICEPGQSPFKLELGNISANHGTACLGITVAEDNGFGALGIARHAQGYFWPIVSQESGGRTQAAILSAIEVFEPGDVLSFSIGPGGCGTLASGASTWTLMRLAADLGITCCIAAGNDCCNLDDAGQFDAQDCGAIIVGACWPGQPVPAPQGMGPFCRLGFSNHCQECEEAVGLVHCSAWGVNVTTCGYGDLFGAADENNRHYTAGFNGTSAACPQIAGLVACLQGISTMMYGIPLTPEGIRAVIAGNLIPQCAIQNPANVPGSPVIPACGGDFDFEEDANLIAGYPDVVSCAAGVLSFNFFDGAPSVRDITLVWGKYIFGNVNSIKGTDNNFYIVESSRRQSGNGTAPNGQHITYLGQGLITDVIVGAVATNPQASATVTVNGNVFVEAAGPVMLVIEFFNWRTGRFDMYGFEVLNGGGAAFDAVTPATFNRGAYVRSDGRMECRLWTLGFTNNQPYRVFYDLVSIRASGNPGPNPGNGGTGTGTSGGSGGAGGSGTGASGAGH